MTTGINDINAEALKSHLKTNIKAMSDNYKFM